VSQDELEALRKKKLLELQRRLMAKKGGAQPGRTFDRNGILKQALVGRAWEVLEAARSQYPEVMPKVEEAIARLVAEGRLKGQIAGEELYAFLRYLGLRVRLETKIRVLESGELKTLAEKLRES